MSEKALLMKKAIPIIVVTWILSLVTTLTVVYYAPSIFPPLTSEKIADGAVTNLKLAPYAIPFSSIYRSNGGFTSTRSTDWIDMDAMSSVLTLGRTSHLLIMFSAVAYNDEPFHRIFVRAMVGEIEADPGPINFTPIVGENDSHAHRLYYITSAYNFYRPMVSAGTYTIKMQWKVTGGYGYISSPTLTIIALPA